MARLRGRPEELQRALPAVHHVRPRQPGPGELREEFGQPRLPLLEGLSRHHLRHELNGSSLQQQPRGPAAAVADHFRRLIELPRAGDSRQFKGPRTGQCGMPVEEADEARQPGDDVVNQLAMDSGGTEHIGVQSPAPHPVPRGCGCRFGAQQCAHLGKVCGAGQVAAAGQLQPENRMDMAVHQAGGQHCGTEVDDLRGRPVFGIVTASDGGNHAPLDRHRLRSRAPGQPALHRVDGVGKDDQIRIHGFRSFQSARRSRDGIGAPSGRPAAPR